MLQKVNMILLQRWKPHEKVCRDLKEHTKAITNCEKLEMIPVTDEENKSLYQTNCNINKKLFENDRDEN